MAAECKRYHSRLAELLSTIKGEDYMQNYNVMDSR